MLFTRARQTIVSDPVAMKAIAVAPSSSLSLRHAVADFGFIDALGPLNVFLGSGVHRFVLKARLYPQLSVDASPLIDATCSAVAAYVPSGVESTVDLLPTMRRILLHVSISLFIGPSVLVRLPQFIDDYVEFQVKRRLLCHAHSHTQLSPLHPHKVSCAMLFPVGGANVLTAFYTGDAVAHTTSLNSLVITHNSHVLPINTNVPHSPSPMCHPRRIFWRRQLPRR